MLETKETLGREGEEAAKKQSMTNIIRREERKLQQGKKHNTN